MIMEINRDLKIRMERLGLAFPEMLLPRNGIDLEKWAVIACDQYTSEPEYWEKAKAIAGTAPSTLNLIFPEVYLGEPGESERITGIKRNMDTYLKNGTLRKLPAGAMLVDRKTPYAESRKGLLLSFRMDRYSFIPGTECSIRPSEKTIVERIPPRVRIREGAPLELPHILILMNDRQGYLAETYELLMKNHSPTYKTGLMLGGGSVKGYHFTAQDDLAAITGALDRMAGEAGFTGPESLLFAVGDGNHSLATAKTVWDGIRERQDLDEESDHPAAWAMAELIDISDPGLTFEPIHRILFNADPNDFSGFCRKHFGCKTTEIQPEALKEPEHLESRKEHSFGVLTAAGGKVFTCGKHSSTVAGTAQHILDTYIAEKNIKIDFLHGWESVSSLAKKTGNIGIVLPPIDKDGFFQTVRREGTLPRKAFSLGEAEEKRYYLEARKIL